MTTKSVKPDPITTTKLPKPLRRIRGSARGKIHYSKDFNAPLPEEILAAFEGKESELLGSSKSNLS